MNIEPKIELIAEKKLIGNRHTLNFTHFNVSPLWKAFNPRKNEIQNVASANLISMSVFKTGYFLDFNPQVNFEKWATVEVLNFEKIPTGMETFVLHSGLYAVFQYKGLSTDQRIFDYIFRAWLPNSKYKLDDRPHFEVLGDKYKNNDTTSEEEIFIPIKLRV